MFKKLKEKLKGWFKSSKETIEETAETVETKKDLRVKEEAEPLVKEKPSIKSKEQPKLEDTKKTKKEKEKLEEIKEVQEKTPESTAEAKEEIEKTQEKAAEIQEIQEKIEKAKETIKKVKEEPKTKDLKTIEELKKDETEKPEILEEEPTKEKSFFQKVKSRFAYKITKEEFNNIFDDLEMLLLENNVALEVVEDIEKKLKEKLIDKEIPKQELEQEIKTELKNTLNEILIEPDNPLDIIKESEKPFVILFFGINGTGKTTSIAKLTHYLKQAGLSVVLAAADTFRAASIEQISEHAKRLDVPLIKHDYESDPSAVGFDAIKYAKNKKIDVVLIDTAGRMHTKQNLLSEMEKINRVTNPNLKIFVAESIAGNDATEQAKAFHDMIQIDGSILSKTDIDEKGGTIISVSHATNKPIFYLGTGQNYEDLELFNKQKFIESLGL